MHASPDEPERPRRAARAAPLAACGAIVAALALVGLARGYDADRAPAPPSEVPAVAASSAPDAGPSGAQIRAMLASRPMDVNRASAVELQLLPRIGPTLAARVVEERERGGDFRSVDDLTRVRGIGPRTVDGLRRLVRTTPDAGGL